MTDTLTPMEQAVLRLVAERNWPGFKVDQIEVVRREHTGVGRYVHFIDYGKQVLPDGTYGADPHFIEMEGIPNGLFFVVEVKNSRILYLELVTCGADSWDGTERAWRIA